MAGSDHDVRLAAVGGQNGERAFKHAGHAAHSLEQVWLAFVRDNLVHDLAEQLSGHLSVGGRGESVAFGLQVETQLRGVFDDAVMDDGHLAVHAGVRVAFTSLGSPLVAQRVWPMPTVASGIGLRSMSSTRFSNGRPSCARPPYPCRARSAPHRPSHSLGIPDVPALQADLQRLAACRFNISRVSNDSTHGSPA